MSIHKEMYIKLFQQVSRTIEDLQAVQLECEKMYIEANPAASFEIKAGNKVAGDEGDVTEKQRGE